jgi:hypothetical protein
MKIPPEPEHFRELCEKIGLALMLSQKVQFSLAHYFAVYHIAKCNWSSVQAKESIRRHLSKPMGAVVSDTERFAPLESAVAQRVQHFKRLRNWLAHAFDEEATRYLSQDERFLDYIAKMDEISSKAYELMLELDAIGEKMIPVRRFDTGGGSGV